jgi:hypothetical protein
VIDWVFLNVPLWVVFIPVVVLLLRLLLKKREPSERERFYSHATDMDSPEKQAVLREIDNIRRTDPSFKTKTFLKWAKNEVIQKVQHVRICAFVDGKFEDTGIQALAILKNNCTDEMMQVIQSECGKEVPFATGNVRGPGRNSYGEYDSDISQYRELLYLTGIGRVLIIDRIIELGLISRAWQTFGHDHILIQVTRDINEYPCVEGKGVDWENGKPVREDSSFTFSRSSGSNEWKLSAKKGPVVSDWPA